MHLITHVETTAATVHESQRTAAIHQALVAKQLPPGEHFVDAAYVDAALLVDSHEQYGIDLFGPTRPNPSWQAKVEGAYELDQFEIDWDQQQVRCPQGKVATAWKEGLDGAGQPIIYVGFRIKECQACPARARCTRGKYRHLHLKPRPQFEALQTTRQRLATADGQRRYQRRAGIEGTLSQGVRAFGLRCCRYRGLAKTALQHIATAAAINLDRIVAWLNEIPHAKTRISRFAKLAPA